MYKPKRRAVAYARFSSDNQREESIDAQLRAIEEYATKNNLEIIESYIGRAKSATSADRPDFLRMIKDSSSGAFDVVIVHKLDRFARNRYDSAKYKYDLKKNGVMVVSVTENIGGSPESVILEGIAEAKKQGKYTGRKPITNANFDKIYTKWQKGDITVVKAASMLGMSKSTFYRNVRKV